MPISDNPIPEKDRLDLLATKADLDVLGRELRAEMGELRGEVKSDLASNLRLMFMTQVTTMMMVGAWITAVT